MRFIFLLFLFVVNLVHADEFLDPAVAFKPSVRAVDARTLEVRFDVADGYYLYREKVHFSTEDASVRFGQAQFPAGKIKNDENFGKVEVYFKQLVVRLPVETTGKAAASFDLSVVYQGCAEAGVCYPPQTLQTTVTMPAAGAADPVVTEKAEAAPAGDETGKIAQSLKNSGFFANLFFFFLAGLGLSLTPCVFPMIPILSGIIAGQGSTVSRSRGFALSVAYVLGMSVTYSAAGVAAGLSGTLISSALQNAWVLGGFAMVFVALSFSMFGFYDLQLPNALQSKLSNGAGHLQGGRGVGVFLMGALSALIVGPCVAAPLAGALLYIGQTGNAVLGGSALFAMALGMGVPLLLVGLSAGTLLPRAGAWMDAVKKFFGVLLLGTAIWLVSPVIPAGAQMVAWAVLLIVPAIYLHALDPLPANAGGWQRFWKGCGLVMVITGGALLVGVLAGNRDPLQPLAGLRQQGVAQAAEAPHLPFQRVTSVSDLEAKVKASGKPVMLDFYADWCVACKEMERFTFSNASVQAQLAGYTLLQADVTANSEQDKALLKRFGLFGPPGIVFFKADGSESPGGRIVGFQESGKFLDSLKSL
jgi:thiol:disulfide interchange protein DsbD